MSSEIAAALREIADIDEAEGGNPHVIAKEREAASRIEALEYANKQMKLEFRRLAIDIAAEAAVASRAGQMKSLEGLSQFCLSQAKE